MVPGMNDLGLNSFPRKEFPDTFFYKLKENIPLFINATNPSRFTLLKKNFLITKTDLLK